MACRLGYYSRPIGPCNTSSTLQQFAQRVLYNNGIEHTLGVRCHRRFLKRHSEMKTSRAQIVNYKRVNAARAENINIFFDRLDYPEIRAIKYANT
jgi:hypothetical protein